MATRIYARDDETAARALFERIRTERWSLVEEWRRERTRETSFLEFKLKRDPTSVDLDADNDDADHIARTLSAFANTGGGVLVLGVHAGGGKGKTFDRVLNLVPIANVEAFASKLERRLRTFTDPIISGIDVEAIEKPDATEGVAVVLVPPSGGGPHRAANASSEVNDRYYMRTTTSAQTIPHPHLAAMFGRRPPPLLRLMVRFRLAPEGQTNHQIGP